MVRFGIEGQNLGTFLENKVHWELKLSKYVNEKNCYPIHKFINENKIIKSAGFTQGKMTSNCAIPNGIK